MSDSINKAMFWFFPAPIPGQEGDKIYSILMLIHAVIRG